MTEKECLNKAAALLRLFFNPEAVAVMRFVGYRKIFYVKYWSSKISTYTIRTFDDINELMDYVEKVTSEVNL